MLRAVVAAIVLCHATLAQISVVDNAYSGVVVSIRDDLDSQRCDEYVNGIKNMITEGSSLLHTATERRLSFGTVTIVVPEGWLCTGVTETSSIPWEEAPLRVGPSHPIFEGNPWTQQPRGCGEPGDFIYFPQEFLTATSTLGPHGSVLVHEWAKFRWGVFEEYGHQDDEIFPSVRWSYANESLTPNYCTDGDVAGDFLGRCEEGDLDSCFFQPNAEQTTGVTSSLLAAPFLPSVNTFCTSESHVADALTKHNLLCDKRSTWQVISEHDDIANTVESEPVTPTFSVKRFQTPPPTGDKLVFLLDRTAAMRGLNDRWGFLRDVVKEFILAEAASGMQVGLVSFTNTADMDSDLVALNTQADREALAAKVPEASTTDPTKTIVAGINKAKEVLAGEGVVVLVTENLSRHTSETGEALVAAAGGTAVWPLLYPEEPGTPHDIYQALADANSQVSLKVVQNEVAGIPGTLEIQSVNNREALAGHLRAIQAAVRGDSPEEIASAACTDTECQMELEVPPNNNFQKEFFVEVYFCTVDGSEIEITVNYPNGTEMASPSEQATSKLYIGNDLKSGKYNVTVNRKNTIQETRASLVARQRPPSGGYSVQVWSSEGLQSLQYTPDSAPTLFAMVKDGYAHIVNARVAATVTPTSGTSFTLVMRDDGTGADVTGNDGVYSAFLVGPSALGDVSLQVSADDNGGAARIVSSSRKAPPVDQGIPSCCGSRVPLPPNLPSPGPFSTSMDSPATGTVTGTVPTNLPPGRITDLKSSLSSRTVTLTFTAPGEDLDQGTATRFNAKFAMDNGTITTYTNETTVTAGTAVVLTFELPDCDVLFHITMTATDAEGLEGKASNEVRESVSCDVTQPPPTDNPGDGNTGGLSGGAIAGIVVGVILFLILVGVGVYLILNRDHLDDLWLWRTLTCRTCRKDDDGDIYNPPAPRSTRSGQDVIRETPQSSSTPARSLNDLYAKPNLSAKKTRSADEDDGGFGERKSRTTNNVAMNNLGNAEYDHSSAAINQVGLPPSDRESNYGPPQDYSYEGEQNQYDHMQYQQPYSQQYDQQYGQQYEQQYDPNYGPQYGANVNAGYRRTPPPTVPRKSKSNTQV